MLGPQRKLRLALQALLTDLSLDRIECADPFQRFFGALRLDIFRLINFSARMRPTLRVGQSSPLCILSVSSIPIGLQYRPCWRRQSQRFLHMTGRATRIVQKAYFVLLSINRPEIGRLHLACAGWSSFNRRLIHRLDARCTNRFQLRGVDRLQ